MTNEHCNSRFRLSCVTKEKPSCQLMSVNPSPTRAKRLPVALYKAKQSKLNAATNQQLLITVILLNLLNQLDSINIYNLQGKEKHYLQRFISRFRFRIRRRSDRRQSLSNEEYTMSHSLNRPIDRNRTPPQNCNRRRNTLSSSRRRRPLGVISCYDLAL